MPTLPDPSRIQRRAPRVSTNVQSPAFTGAGDGLKQVAGAFADLADLGQQQVAIKKKEEERQDRLELGKAKAEWKKTRAEQSIAYDQDQDFKTIEERYRGELTKRSGEILAAIKNPEHRELFQQQLDSDIEVGSIQMHNLAFRKESDFEVSRLDEDLVDLRKIALEANDDEAIKIAGERITDAVDAGYLTQTQATNLRQSTTRDYAISRIELADPMQRRALINGSLGTYLDPDDKKKLLKSAGREYSRGLDDYISYLSAGNEPDANLDRKFSSGNVRAFMGENAGNVNEAIGDARKFGTTLNEIKTASPEELRAIVDRETPKSPDQFKRESKQLSIVQKAINQRNKQISNDPAAYVNGAFPEVEESFNRFTEAYQTGTDLEAATQDYAEEQRRAQESLGLPYNSVQLLPEQVENQIATQLNDYSQGGEKTALNVYSLKRLFGSEWPTVQRQLQSNKKIGGNLRVLSGMDFGPEMVSLAEAQSVGPKAYKETINPDIYKEITEKSMGELEDFQNTLRGQPGSEGAYREHKAAVETLAMKYISDGLYDDADDALNQAVDDVLGKRFEFVGSYRIPKQHNPEQVESNVDLAIDDIKAGKYELFIPQSSSVLNDEDRKEVYRSVLQPKPITSPDGDGVLFIDQNGNAILKPNGEAIVIPWVDLDKSPDKVYGLFGEEL